MGFSVSGAAAIIFASLFIAFGAFYTATADSFERTTEAEGAYAEDVRELRNTHISIDSVKNASAPTNPTAGSQVVINATNTGASQLSLKDTDLLVNGTYVHGWQIAGAGASSSVNGDSGTDLWLPGEQLRINLDRTNVTRVKLVASRGVSDVVPPTEVAG